MNDTDRCWEEIIKHSLKLYAKRRRRTDTHIGMWLRKLFAGYCCHLCLPIHLHQHHCNFQIKMFSFIKGSCNNIVKLKLASMHLFAFTSNGSAVWQIHFYKYLIVEIFMQSEKVMKAAWIRIIKEIEKNAGKNFV